MGLWVVQIRLDKQKITKAKKKINMITTNNIGKIDDYVYDISLDGTVVNALGMNVVSNTDGFNFKKPDDGNFRYTDENPYISDGGGRNSVKGKAYTGVDADVAEFEDLFLNKAYNGGNNKSGLGIDEYCDSCLQMSRKNYADLMPNGSTKKVGNTIKSRKMSGYLEKFIDNGTDLLLHAQGHKFILEYYAYIEKIYNYQIPLKDIASKGNIKKPIEDYIKDCLTVTKAGTKKARQAWYELVIKEGLKPNVGDTIYYINTGTKKGQSDAKRVTHYYYMNGDEKVEITKETEKLWKEYIKDTMNDSVKKKIDLAKEKYGPTAFEEDEIILACKLVPNEILDTEEEVLCSDVDGMDYNVEKYIDQFNKRITPLLVCFSKDIRDQILITDPKDRKYFTEEQAKLVSGEPMKEGDQDTLEALMTPEKKEIEFWLSIGKEPPFVKECGIDWEGLVKKYLEDKKAEETEAFKSENSKYLACLAALKPADVRAFEEEGKLPPSISSMMILGPDFRLRFKALPEMTPTTGGFVFDDITIQSEDVGMNIPSNATEG